MQIVERERDDRTLFNRCRFTLNAGTFELTPTAVRPTPAAQARQSPSSWQDEGLRCRSRWASGGAESAESRC